jgi:glycosyltransferase involved in cell wall biosynthesis
MSLIFGGNRMSVCIITEEAVPPLRRFSMAYRSAEYLCSEFEVHLVYVKSPLSIVSDKIYLHPIDIRWDEFNLTARLKTQWKLIETIIQVSRKYKIDLLYGWWLASFIGGKLTKKRFVADMPEFIEEMYRSFSMPLSSVMMEPLRSLQRAAAQKSEAIIVESGIAKEVWIRRSIPPRKIYSIPYGVEVDLFNPSYSGEIRDKYGIPEDAILVIYHGDIGFDDGVDLLIRAVSSLDVWCLCVGSGPKQLMKYLKSIANNRTIFTGWVPYRKIPKYLGAADIYVAPFRSTLYTNTTFPLKIMEAMAAGKPVITSSLRALSKVVRDGYDVKLIKPGDLGKLRLAIKDLIEEEELRKKLGYNARKTAIEKFDWKLRARREAEILRNLISERG